MSFMRIWSRNYNLTLDRRVDMNEFQETSMTEAVTGYCMKCKHSRVIDNPVKTTMSNGRIRVSGDCSSKDCTGSISKIIS